MMSGRTPAMPAPLVSVICPTFQREHHLRDLVRYFGAQTCRDTELLILDDTPTPAWLAQDRSDPRIQYLHHRGARLPIGAKRNLLMARARGEIIVQFDDDDYYAPTYVERMVEHLGDADFVKLSRWFGYRHEERLFFYWATDRMAGHHFVVSSREEAGVVSTQDWNPATFIDDNLWGWGFSYVWRKHVHPKVEFPLRDWGEDIVFTRKLHDGGFKMKHVADEEGLVLHVIHKGNSSRSYPQFVLPNFLLPKFFPTFASERGL